jgi:GxxExxY protein
MSQSPTCERLRRQFEQLSSRVIEAAIAVHRELGPGFLESIYESAMKTALRHRGIVYDCQKEVAIVFEGAEAGVHRLDLLVANEIIVELKALKAQEYANSDCNARSVIVAEGGEQCGHDSSHDWDR